MTPNAPDGVIGKEVWVAKVFVSYASVDVVLAREVHGWLVEAGHEVFLDRDLREGIAAGEAWRGRLLERLRWADAVVCVVTSAYVMSNWCTAEVATAQTRGSRVLPLRAEPGVDHPLLADAPYTALTRDPVAARAALAAALRRIDAAGGLGWPDDRSPFPGLRPFEIDQHRVFFGRTDDVKALAEFIRATVEEAVHLVVGPSGCGKSSLVRAGLIPVMAAEPGWRVLPPILPGADPVAALARELATSARRTGLDWTVDQVHQRLDTGGVVGLADDLLTADPDGPQRRLLIVIDQFEELLTYTAPDRRARFAELLSATLAGPVRVVGTLRPEFLDQLLTDPALATLATRVRALQPLRRAALRAVVEGPARFVGIDVEAPLVARLVEDTGSGEALPLLAFTLAQLVDGVGRGGRLSTTRYEQLGGVQGALTRQADATLADAVTAGGRSREEVLGGLLRLVTVDEQGYPTRWRVDRAELPAAVVTELDAFVARRLLTTDTLDGAVVIGAAHEAFLSAWPPLAEAIAANVMALRARRAVEHAAAEWHAHDRPSSRLWGGGQLAAAVADTGARTSVGGASPPDRRGWSRWLPRRLSRRPRVLVTDRVDLSSQARNFLLTSIRRDRDRRRRGVTVLSVLLILALVGAGIAVVAQQRTQERQRAATAGQLVVDAESARSTDLRAALLLGLAAHRLRPDSDTRSSLVNTLAGGPYAGTLTGHTGQVGSVAFTPDGSVLATASNDRTVILWDITDPAGPRQLGQPLTGHTGAVTSVAFAPDGRTLVTGSADNTVIVWDVTDRAQPRQLGSPLTGHTGAVNDVAFAPDGRTLVTGSADNTVIVWDLTDRAQPRQLGSPLTGHSGPVTSLTLAPDGNTLATNSSETGNAILWDLTDRTEPRQLGSPLNSIVPGSIDVVEFAPDGRTLATTYDGKAVLWDVTDPAQPHAFGPPLTGHTSVDNVVAFTPDGRTMATAGALGTTMLWDVTDPAQPHSLGPPLTGHTTLVKAAAFSPDGRTLVTGGQDTAVIMWDVTTRVQPRQLGPPLTGHTGPVVSAAFSPDGRTLATGAIDTTAILWDVTDPAQPRSIGPPLTGHSGSVWSVAFSQDGKILATASEDQKMILWDVTDPARPRPLGSPLTGQRRIFSAAFSPDGRTLATGGSDDTVVLWDVTDPAQPNPLGLPLTGHTGTVWSVAFSPDGRTLATSSRDATVILWDLADLIQPHPRGPPLTGHTGIVKSVAFAPDGRTLATGSSDRTVILWELTDPIRSRSLSPPRGSKTSDVWSVAFAADGRTLATGGDFGGTLWDVADPAQPHLLGPPLGDLKAGVWSVAFSSDGHTLATGTTDNTVILWDLTDLNRVRDHAVERACAITDGGLDREEWERSIPDLPYQDSCPS